MRPLGPKPPRLDERHTSDLVKNAVLGTGYRLELDLAVYSIPDLRFTIAVSSRVAQTPMLLSGTIQSGCGGSHWSYNQR
jgi:hypothetical protein